jgi:ubiquitin-protein ligase
MAQSKLNKALYTDITRLKLCSKPTAEVRFLLDKCPFDDDDETSGDAKPKEYVIIGRILPNSDIFKQGAYQIEMKLPSDFPQNPPFVRFITSIYHPNVNKDGIMSSFL